MTRPPKATPAPASPRRRAPRKTAAQKAAELKAAEEKAAEQAADQGAAEQAAAARPADPQRIARTPREEWSEELVAYTAQLRAKVVGENSDHPSGANLFATLAGFPELAMAFLGFNGYLLHGSPLPVRVRELLVLRVAHLRGCAYEWAQHVPLATEAGYTGEDIRRITDGPDAPGWTPFEQALLRAVDELFADGVVSDPTWAVLAGELDQRQLVDLVFVVGTYSMVAMAMRSFRVELDADLTPFLPGKQ